MIPVDIISVGIFSVHGPSTEIIPTDIIPTGMVPTAFIPTEIVPLFFPPRSTLKLRRSLMLDCDVVYQRKLTKFWQWLAQYVDNRCMNFCNNTLINDEEIARRKSAANILHFEMWDKLRQDDVRRYDIRRYDFRWYKLCSWTIDGNYTDGDHTDRFYTDGHCTDGNYPCFWSILTKTAWIGGGRMRVERPGPKGWRHQGVRRHGG